MAATPVQAIVTRLGRVSSAALLIAAVYGVALIIAGFLAPAYESTSVSSSGETTHGSGTLASRCERAECRRRPRRPASGDAGRWVHPVAALSPWRGAIRAWTLTGLLAGFNLLAMLSIGVFLLPVTAAVIVACAMCRSRSKPPVTAPHPAVAG